MRDFSSMPQFLRSHVVYERWNCNVRSQKSYRLPHFLLYLFRGQICNKVRRFREFCGCTCSSGTATAPGGQMQNRAWEGKDLWWLMLGEEKGMWQPGKGNGKWDSSDSSCNGRGNGMEEDWDRSAVFCVWWWKWSKNRWEDAKVKEKAAAVRLSCREVETSTRV